MLDGAIVPCTPTLPWLSPSQNAPSGLLGPGSTRIGCLRPARRASCRMDCGTFQVGFSSLVVIVKDPVGVGQSARPTATGSPVIVRLRWNSIRCGMLITRGDEVRADG